MNLLGHTSQAVYRFCLCSIAAPLWATQSVTLQAALLEVCAFFNSSAGEG